MTNEQRNSWIEASFGHNSAIFDKNLEYNRLMDDNNNNSEMDIVGKSEIIRRKN